MPGYPQHWKIADLQRYFETFGPVAEASFLPGKQTPIPCITFVARDDKALEDGVVGMQHTVDNGKTYFSVRQFRRGQSPASRVQPLLPASSFRCELCQLHVPTMDALSSHVRGNKHKQNAAQAPDARFRITCVPCSTLCLSFEAMEKHIGGKKHAAVLGLPASR